jgi:hypothetical protein
MPNVDSRFQQSSRIAGRRQALEPLKVESTTLKCGHDLQGPRLNYESQATEDDGTVSEWADFRLGALMVAVQAGDHGAYASLLRNCAPIIRRAAHLEEISASQFDDVTKVTLLSLHEARQTYDRSRSFNAWLAAIARRRAAEIICLSRKDNKWSFGLRRRSL